jgi:putative membrane protein
MYFKKFLRSKGVIGSLIIILFYGLLMVGVYFSGIKLFRAKLTSYPSLLSIKIMQVVP